MATPAQWTPSVDDVAALIPQRTGDPTGAAQTTFTATTVPTATQVANIIGQVVNEVAGTVGVVPDNDPGGPGVRASLIDMAKRVVALGAAAEVETSFYPDQNVGGMGIGAVLYARYKDALKGLLSGVQTVLGGGAPGSADMGVPVYSFPAMTDVPTPGAPLTTYGEQF